MQQFMIQEKLLPPFLGKKIREKRISILPAARKR